MKIVDFFPLLTNNDIKTDEGSLFCKPSLQSLTIKRIRHSTLRFKRELDMNLHVKNMKK